MKNVFKLSILAASLLVASTASLAAGNYKGVYKGEEPAPCPAPARLLDGFYLGIAGGYDSYRVRENRGFTGAGAVATDNPAINATGFVGGLLGGYGQYLNDVFYLGGELFVNASGASE